MSNKDNSLTIITVLIIILGLVASLMGLFYISGSNPFDYVNQYGDIVKISGAGLYANDSFFVAPILRGTDFTFAVLAIPILIVGLIRDIRRNSLKSRLFLLSVIAAFTYYSASLAFGVTYNILHLVYIALFSVCLFGLIIAICSMDRVELKSKVTGRLPYKGFNIFFVLTGIVLIAAWLPDIIISLQAGRPLAMIENYTTSITNVIDMGIIGPVAMISAYQLKKRSGLGYILAGLMFTVCVIVGVMVPMQTVFQLLAGVELPLPAVISKVASFMILAPFALYFDIRLFRAIKN